MLGDKPETVLWTHGVARGMCNVYVAGDPPRYRAAIVQATNIPAVPTSFGSDAKAIWELLRLVNGWKYIVVDMMQAYTLGKIIHENSGLRVRYLGDLHYILPDKTPTLVNHAVRRLTIDDLELLEASPSELYSSLWDSVQDLLLEGIVMGVIIGEKIVATARLTSISSRYADIAVDTLPDFRGQGLATAAASALIRATTEMGKAPVWSTSESNVASRKVAEKLGFAEVLRRVYLVPENTPSFDIAHETPPNKGDNL